VIHFKLRTYPPPQKTHFAVLFVLLIAAASFAQVEVGASVAAGSRFIVGGRLKCVSQNRYLPQPVLSITGTPLAKKRLFRVGAAEYMQLQEKTMFFTLGLLEQLYITQMAGFEAEVSLGIVEGWYRGTDRDYLTKAVPVIAAGPLFKLNDYFNMVLRLQWYRIETVNNFVGSFIIETSFK